MIRKPLKIIAIVVNVVFLINPPSLGADLSDKTYLRKQLDFNKKTDEVTSRYLSATSESPRLVNISKRALSLKFGDIINEIQRIKQERGIFIIAHNYSRVEVKEIADFVGDALSMVQKACKVPNKTIMVLAVQQVYEAIKVLNPNKRIITASQRFLCPVPSQFRIEELEDAISRHPEAAVVLHFDTSLEAKVLADCIVTARNAVDKVNSLPQDTIIYGHGESTYHALRNGTDKTIIGVCLDVVCRLHTAIRPDWVMEAKERYPDSVIAVHTECLSEVQRLADHVSGSDGIYYFVKSKIEEGYDGFFLVASEHGLVDRLHADFPEHIEKIKNIRRISCRGMKTHGLQAIKSALETQRPEVEINREAAEGSKLAFENMLLSNVDVKMLVGSVKSTCASSAKTREAI
ncbi:MAG: quinolinate synthase NadA [Planctomycetota bacterium]